MRFHVRTRVIHIRTAEWSADKLREIDVLYLKYGADQLQPAGPPRPLACQQGSELELEENITFPGNGLFIGSDGASYYTWIRCLVVLFVIETRFNAYER